MRTLARRALYAAGILTMLGAVGILAAMPAEAITDPTGNYSVTGTCPPPSGNGACSAHFTAGSNPGNYNTRAYEICENVNTGALFEVDGGWKTGTGNTSNTNACNNINSHAFTLKAGFDFRQSAPVRRQCYSFTAGDPRSGFC